MYDFCPSGVKRSLANARKHLSQAENHFIDMARVIEKLPSHGQLWQPITIIYLQLNAINIHHCTFKTIK